MGGRSEVYFASDVHLGLRIGDPGEREARFTDFLKSIPRERTRALYLLGDIWDFWFEYRDVVPRCGARVVAALVERRQLDREDVAELRDLFDRLWEERGEDA